MTLCGSLPKWIGGLESILGVRVERQKKEMFLGGVLSILTFSLENFSSFLSKKKTGFDNCFCQFNYLVSSLQLHFDFKQVKLSRFQVRNFHATKSCDCADNFADCGHFILRL